MNELRMLMAIMVFKNFKPFIFYANIALCLADFATMFFFAHRLFHKKKRSVLAAGVCAAAGALLTAFITEFFWNYSPMLGMFFNIGTVIFLILALQFIYKDKLGCKAAYALLFMTAYTLVDIILMDLLLSLGAGWNAYFYGMDKNGTFTLMFCVTRRIIGLAAAALLYSIMQRFPAEVFRRDRAVLDFIALIFFWSVQLFGVYSAGKSIFTPKILLAVNAVIGSGIIIALFVLLNSFPKIAAKLRKSAPDAVKSFDAAPSDGSGLSPREMQKLRHDVKNNIATISALIDSGESSEAKRLLDELGERLGSALGGEGKTNITAVDTEVSRKAQLCREHSITLDIHAEPLPDTVIPPIDLSSVISNILDNAIEAAQNCEDPLITLKIFKYKSYIAIVCENPIDAAPHVVNGRLATTKDGEGHGYGMEIINEICKNNNGRFQYEFDGRKFKASAFLEL